VLSDSIITNGKLEMMWKKAVVHIFKYDPTIRMEGLWKTMKNIIQDIQSLGQDLKPRTPKYEAGMLIPASCL
jgi:hypothetical protein